jgi:hypothetical protein
MKTVGHLIRASIVFVVLYSSIQLSFCSTPDFPKCPPYVDLASTWTEKNYRKAIDALMPMNFPTSLKKDQWVLKVRIEPSFFDELQFTFIRYPDRTLQGIGISPSGGKIEYQLTELKELHPQSELNELIQMVDINRWQTKFQSNEKLENDIRFLQQYKPPPKRKDLFCLDGTGYKISLRTESKRFDFSIGCEERPELLQIVNKFRDLLYGYQQIDYDLLASLKKKDVKSAIQLIQNGANPELQTPEGDQSWFIALGLRDTDLIKVMLEKHPKLVQQGNPVVAAARHGSGKVVQILLEAGADMNESTSFGETPLMVASDCPDEVLKVINRTANDFEFVVNELIKAGADLNRQNKSGSNALMLAIMNRNNTIAENLIDAGAEVNAIDNCGNTALILAAKEGQIRIVEKLLHAGADAKIVDVNGKTASDYAVEKRNQELIRLLN